MNLLQTSALAGLCLCALNSCMPGPNAQYGSAMGGLAGAALGGVVGHQSGRELEGAALGAVAGSLFGNQLGASQDAALGYTPPAPVVQQAPAPVYYEQSPVYVERTYIAEPCYSRPRYYRSHHHHCAPRHSSHVSFSTGGCW